jgi:Cdc6-like AAA superfamily ATPase
MTYDSLNLAYNPFEEVTFFQNKLFWAGMVHQKKQIEKVFQEAFERKTRQVVLNWGPYGGGKTFAAEYFSKTPKPTIAPDETQFIPIIIATPQDGTNVVKNLIDRIMATFSPDFLGQGIHQAIESLGRTALIQKIHDRIQNHEIATTLVHLCDATYPHAASSAASGGLILKYYYDNFDKKQLTQLKINRALKGDDNYIQFLSGLFVALTATRLEKRIFLWMDEMEQLLYYNAKQYRTISQTIRELSDKVSENLTIFLNLSLTENDVNKVNILLGSALESRINRRIRFRDLTMEDALLYCKDLMQHASIQPKQNVYFPLTQPILITLLETLPKEKITPREINRICYNFLNYMKDKKILSVTMNTFHEYQKDADYAEN